MKDKPKISITFQANIKNNKVLFLCYLNLNIKIKKDQVKHVRPGSTRYTNDTQNVKYKQEVISTGITIPQAFYDKANKQCLGQYSYLNIVLPKLKEGVLLIYDKYCYTSTLLIDLFKDEIKKYFKSQVDNSTDRKVSIKEVSLPIAPTLFISYIEYKIKEWSSGLSSKTANTIVNHKKFKNWVLKYEQERNIILDLLMMNNNTLKDFIIWVSAKHKSDGQPFKLSYINYFKTQFKIFINEAVNEDDMDLPNLNLNKKFMKKKTEETDDIYLRLNQLKMIEVLSFDIEDILLEEARDLFLVGCYTGFRWQTLSILTEEHFKEYSNGEWYFTFNKTKKTKANVEIPMFDKVVLKIFRKYGNSFPKISNEQHFNKRIKIIGMRAKLNRNVTVSSLHPVTLQTIEQIKKEYDLITSRTCRKTFASNCVREWNQGLFLAMSYTGHKKEESFKKYIRLSPREYAEISYKQMLISGKMRVA